MHGYKGIGDRNARTGRKKKLDRRKGRKKKTSCNWRESAARKRVVYVPFSRLPTFVSDTSLQLPHLICELTMPQTSQSYKCQCSKCNGTRKAVTKRTIESHLEQDRHTLHTTSSQSTDLLGFIQSRIDANIRLLAMIHGGPRTLSEVPDLDGTYSQGSEGVLSSGFQSHIINYYLHLNWHLVM